MTLEGEGVCYHAYKQALAALEQPGVHIVFFQWGPRHSVIMVSCTAEAERDILAMAYLGQLHGFVVTGAGLSTG
jgi:hypothetical protein